MHGERGGSPCAQEAAEMALKAMRDGPLRRCGDASSGSPRGLERVRTPWLAAWLASWRLGWRYTRQAGISCRAVAAPGDAMGGFGGWMVVCRCDAAASCQGRHAGTFAGKRKGWTLALKARRAIHPWCARMRCGSLCGGPLTGHAVPVSPVDCQPVLLPTVLELRWRALATC